MSSREAFVKKYGDVVVRFDYYYKFSFHFVGELTQGGWIYVVYGGTPEDIAHEYVSYDREYKVRDLNWISGEAYKHNGAEIVGFDEGEESG